MQQPLIRNLAIVSLLATTSVPALAQTADPVPAPPAAETPAPAPATPPPADATPPAAAPAETAPAPQAQPAPAQQSQPAPAGETVPEVEVIQEPKPKPKPKPQQAAKPKPKPKPAAAPEPAPAATAEPEPVAAPVEPAPAAPAELTESNGPPPFDTPVKMSPISGSEIPLEKVPGAVGRATAAEIQEDGTGQVQNTLNKTVPGIILSDTAGGGLRTDIQYRGFDASPIGGRSQGLAVYQNGVRINEAFGDTVNLDLIPAIAISDMTVLGANPVYGLNAVGGAIGITMKDGFSFEGGTIDAMGGSFGRGMISMEAGGNSGTVGAYAALELMREDGFRDFSESDIERFYGDLGFKGSSVEVHVSLTAAQSNAGVVAASPVEVLDVDWNRTFTNPQDTDLEVIMPTLSAKVQATDTLSFSGIGYYRKFKSNVIDGNLSEVEECSTGNGLLCLAEIEDEDGDGFLDFEEEEVRTRAGDTVSAALFDTLGSIERINTEAESFGGSLQAVSTAELFGRPNQFTIGTSYDRGEVHYTTSSELGEIGRRFVVDGSGIVLAGPDDVAPRLLDTKNDYYGLYFTNTLDVTDAFALTVGGRYNHATIQLIDLTGDFPELNTTNKYERFNPMVGGTYKVVPGLTLYGSYAEANRAPTAAELGCAEPDNPCLIESFLTDDPPLKQVVSRTFELGLRGEQKYFDGSRLNWSAGLFRTLNQDDILNVAAEETGRGYFLNAGDTLRQGVELAAAYQTRTYSVYGSYAFIDATFADDIILPAPNTPRGTEDCPDLADASALPPGVEFDEPQCNFVRDGDSLPGIPKHRFKAGFEYWLTPQWRFGADFIAATDQVFFGDEANNNRKLPGYTRVDVNTSYKLSENAEAYGLIKNLFDRRYGLYGTFFDAEEAEEAFEAAGYDEPEDRRSISPALPFAIYGGLRITF